MTSNYSTCKVIGVDHLLSVAVQLQSFMLVCRFPGKRTQILREQNIGPINIRLLPATNVLFLHVLNQIRTQTCSLPTLVLLINQQRCFKKLSASRN
jgi:hypothetical protein